MNPNISLGSGSFYINDYELSKVHSLITISEEEFPQYIKSFSLTNPESAEFTVDAEVDLRLLNKRSFIYNAPQSISAEFSEPYQEQRRKHKKKRINKKWAKRYGYVTKFRKFRINEISIMPNNEFEFEATGRNIELIKM